MKTECNETPSLDIHNPVSNKTVIPAKAGIQRRASASQESLYAADAAKVDSRRSGNDKQGYAKGLVITGIICCIFLLSGCADLVANADNIAQPSGMHRTQVKTNPFILTAYTKITDKSQPYNIYIEGDGLAWVSRNQPSVNPTPRKALALSLAALDNSPNVIYIARPCQFTPLENDNKCEVAYWTDKRFSEKVISSVNQAIDKLAGKEAKINLIGYSGGGGVAALVAARRSDVVSIRTVAGNLDHVELHRINDVSQLHGSLNAIDEAKKLSSIPQIHFAGAEDEVVPPAIAKKFIKASGETKCIKLSIIKDATHESGWTEIWPKLLKHAPKCGG